MSNVSLDQLSLTTLAQLVPTDILAITMAVAPLILNVFVIITILGKKTFRENKSQLLIASLSFAEVLHKVLVFAVFGEQYRLYRNGIPQTATKKFCFFYRVPHHYMDLLIEFLVLNLAIDRLLCILLPLFYNTCKLKTYVLLLNAVAWGACLVQVSIAYAVLDSDVMVPACTRGTSFNAAYLQFHTIVLDVILAMITAAYVTLAVVMWRRYKTANLVSQSQKSVWRRQMEYDIFVSIVLVGVIAIFVYGAGVILVSVNSDLLTAQRVGVATTIFLSFNSCSHFLICFKVNKKFRGAFLNIVCRKKEEAVTAVTVSVTPLASMKP